MQSTKLKPTLTPTTTSASPTTALHPVVVIPRDGQQADTVLQQQVRQLQRPSRKPWIGAAIAIASIPIAVGIFTLLGDDDPAPP
ncbi:MAG: hypothetical protein MUP13_08050, partial [Thermoanaerobaculales bacterium]|nr:hypothetical protein [Thermoanaerobaculales bacterium]